MVSHHLSDRSSAKYTIHPVMLYIQIARDFVLYQWLKMHYRACLDSKYINVVICSITVMECRLSSSMPTGHQSSDRPQSPMEMAHTYESIDENMIGMNNDSAVEDTNQQSGKILYCHLLWLFCQYVVASNSLITLIVQRWSSPTSATYMCWWTRWALIQVMACSLFGAKPLPKSMLSFFSVGPLRANLNEIRTEIQKFNSSKCI